MLYPESPKVRESRVEMNKSAKISAPKNNKVWL